MEEEHRPKKQAAKKRYRHECSAPIKLFKEEFALSTEQNGQRRNAAGMGAQME